MKNWVVLPLRIILGLIFIKAGLGKAFGLFGGPGIEGFADMLSKIGFSPSIFWALLVAYAELICGIMVLIGLFARSASVIIGIIMLVAIFKVHFNEGFEYPLIMLASCASLFLYGPGLVAVKDKY